MKNITGLVFFLLLFSDSFAQPWVYGMTNDGGWDVVYGAQEGGGVLIGRQNGNTSTLTDRSHILYRNNNGGIYYGYNSVGAISTTINSQTGGNSFLNNGGYFGIGTNAPGYPLDVNGVVNISGDVLQLVKSGSSS